MLHIAAIIADQIGTAAMLLGAGRQTKESAIDLAVGLVLHKKIGDPVKKDESLVTVHANTDQIHEIISMIYASYSISDFPVEPPKLIYEVVT
jgi:pyrimidine-nucleoside phosphorylase